MTTLSTFKKTTRAAVAALVIGAASISAMPAQAAGNNVNLGFSFNAGNGLSFSIDAGDRQYNRGDRHRGDRRFECLTDREIRRGLRAYGFEDIRFGQERRGKVYVEAERGRWDYSMRIDRCTGDVTNIERKRDRRDRDWGRDRHDSRGDGLRFEFKF